MRCSKCHNDVDPKEEFCPHCGRRITPPVRKVNPSGKRAKKAPYIDEGLGGDKENEGESPEQKKNNKLIVIVVICAIAAMLAVASVVALFFLKGAGASSDKIDVLQNQVEACEPVDLNELVAVKSEYADEYTVEPVGESNIMFKSTGHTEIEYRLFHKGKYDTVTVGIDVVDTVGPSIEIVKDSIKEGKTFNIEDFVSVEDAVDGKLDGDYIETDEDVDTDTPGEYNLVVTAKDKSGNESYENLTVEVTPKQGSEAEFIQRITGLWLNGCQDASKAKSHAKSVGCTDSSMTEFIKSGDSCYMSTIGDIEGEYGGDTVPYVNDSKINFTYISSDYTEARGTVNGMEITFDMGSPTDQVFLYHCGGYYTHCAYTGFESMADMDDYWR